MTETACVHCRIHQLLDEMYPNGLDREAEIMILNGMAQVLGELLEENRNAPSIIDGFGEIAKAAARGEGEFEVFQGFTQGLH